MVQIQEVFLQNYHRPEQLSGLQTNTINGNKVEVGTDNNPVIGGYPASGYGVVIYEI